MIRADPCARACVTSCCVLFRRSRKLPALRPARIVTNLTTLVAGTCVCVCARAVCACASVCAAVASLSKASALDARHSLSLTVPVGRKRDGNDDGLRAVRPATAQSSASCHAQRRAAQHVLLSTDFPSGKFRLDNSPRRRPVCGGAPRKQGPRDCSESSSHGTPSAARAPSVADRISSRCHTIWPSAFGSQAPAAPRRAPARLHKPEQIFTTRKKPAGN